MARYSDVQLLLILQKSARRINRELALFDTDDEIAIDDAGGITPDDGTLYDLVLMQAECLTSKTDFESDLSSGGAGIVAKDGEQTIDTRDAASARASFFDSPNSPCADLKSALLKEKLNRIEGYDVW